MIENLLNYWPVVAFVLIGFYEFVRTALTVFGAIKRHCFTNGYDLKTRYANSDSWAVVTGGSDGIGLEICNQLGQMGFNICIVGRTKSKIDEKLKELSQKYPRIKTRCVIFDFAQLCTM